jgi:hypothetical protein
MKIENEVLKMGNVKTLKDCSVCPVVWLCDAHVTGGEWKHDGGVVPCRIQTDYRIMRILP